jgi:hypothetical protein
MSGQIFVQGTLVGVTITDPMDADVLTWNESESQWINASPGATIPFDITNPQNDDLLFYNFASSTWNNSQPGPLGLLFPVNVITPANNDIIYYNATASKWENIQPSALGLGTVSSVGSGTGLTGGPITSSGTLSIATTGVSAGSYTNSNLTVNAEGQIIAASNGTSGTVTSVGSGTGLTGGPITGSGTLSIATTGVGAGSYTNSNLTVNAEGQIIAASNGTSGTVTSVGSGTGLTGGPITGSGTLSIATTGVSAGSYTNSNLTVNAEGQITAASNGTSGTVTSVGSGTGLTGGPITGSGTLSIATTGITAGTYYAPEVTFNAEGQATSASNILTTQGDLLGYDGVSVDRFGQGTNGQSLFVNTNASSGFNLDWKTDNLSLINIGIKASVASNALTVAITQVDGSSSPVNSSFIRYPSNGQTFDLAVISSDLISITVPNGATLGTTNSYVGYIYVYSTTGGGHNNSIALSLVPWPTDATVNVTAISASSSSATTLYGGGALSGVGLSYIGKILAPQTTAGVWATAPSRLFTTISGTDYAANWNPVNTDGTTIEGTGLPFSNLSLVPVGSSGNYYGYGFTTNSTGQITAALNTGTGFLATWAQSQSLSNNTVTTILANNLLSTYRAATTPSISSLATGTGVYTCGQDGVYVLTMTALFATAGGGVNALFIKKTDSLATNAVISEISAAGDSGQNALSASATTWCKSGDTLFFQGYQSTGSSIVVSFVCSVCLIATMT